MKRFLPGLMSLVFCGLAGSLHAATVCATTANTNTDCGFIITIGPGGVLTGAAVAGAKPFDGGDDALIGVINNSGAVYTGSFILIGSGNGGGLFAFDKDGICKYTKAAYCGTAATGYEGPLNTFTNITTTSVLHDTGTVNITNLDIGASTYFSLESSPASINSGAGPVLAGPEPGTMPLLGAGLCGLVYIRRRLKA